MYVIKGLTYCISKFGKTCEYLAIKIECQKEELVLVLLYRSPHAEEEDNRKPLHLIKEINEPDSEYKVMCGDFNVPGID